MIFKQSIQPTYNQNNHKIKTLRCNQSRLKKQKLSKINEILTKKIWPQVDDQIQILAESPPIKFYISKSFRNHRKEKINRKQSQQDLVI